MRILTAESMQRVDRRAIEEVGIPSLVLMENAAIGVVDAIAERYPDARSVAIFCGPGNNGGDGLAVGRHLAVRGYHVAMFVVAGGRELRGDAAIQQTICRNLAIDVRELGAEESVAPVVQEAASADLIVDALFGTGLRRALDGQYAELVAAINQLTSPRIAADIPSGLSGDSSRILGPTIEADLTVTFAAVKIPHIFPPAATHVGTVVVADLGIPHDLIEAADGDLHLLHGEELAERLPPRPVNAHKGDFGHLLIVGGAVGTAGAAALATRAAVRAGAGLVTAAVPESVLETVAGASLESMTAPLPVSGPGLDGDALQALFGLAEGKEALALGPGMGTETGTQEVIERFVLETQIPMVLDADGLNAFAGKIRDLSGRAGDLILTPHPGEMARLLGWSTAEVVEDRLGAVREAAKLSEAIVVLKGHLTLAAEPGGAVHVNPVGNPGMATGGSGDVLTGVIGGLLAQGYEAGEAARVGVFLHGLAGDLAAAEVGENGLAATDLVARLPEAATRLAES